MQGLAEFNAATVQLLLGRAALTLGGGQIGYIGHTGC
jgi:hypothetical protein